VKYASAFAGIGGFDLAFEREGWTVTAQIEKNKQRLKVLARHFANAPRIERIEDASGSDIGRPDLVVGGFPCEGVSIGAPNRVGLADARSALYWEFRRLLDELLRLTDYARPRWVVIENAPGLLRSPRSSPGADMAAVVNGLETLGYGWAYRVVDSHDLGSTQRRQRLIVVGHRGGDPRPAWEVLDDTGGGAKATRPRHVGPRRGPASPASPSGPSGELIWRKSARPRAALSKGGYETWVASEFSNVLTKFDAGRSDRQTHLLIQNGRLRTLTPLEWERLQGFPDNWTAGLSDSAREQACGDAMNVVMATWLARRIATVDGRLPLLSTVR